MKQQITIPEGHEIDIQNSDLKNGFIAFKPVEKVYPINMFGINSQGWFITSDSKIDIAIKTRTEDDLNILPTSEHAESMLAFIQCATICHEWNKIDEFVADWTNEEQEKYCIELYKNDLRKENYLHTNKPIHFGSATTRDKFLDTFQPLLEKAKMYL